MFDLQLVAGVTGRYRTSFTFGRRDRRLHAGMNYSRHRESWDPVWRTTAGRFLEFIRPRRAAGPRSGSAAPLPISSRSEIAFGGPNDLVGRRAGEFGEPFGGFLSSD